MKVDDIEVKVIMGENTSKIFTEALLKLYDNNAAKVLNLDEEEKQS
ncbi:hypothetical protein [Clostridium botulinum]|uniref:Uncharacterized protein n=1 Tax=Clostridium botulinum TaxID=1491 RepID=A0ABD7CMU2_CLOBO|nr:hypothetical protein [Clostridium botulinum]MCC5425829.1 hypothetical protein [Clostridium botulinum]QRI54104.1 hypothetical protein JQS73_03010 [Clostridium botulinum]